MAIELLAEHPGWGDRMRRYRVDKGENADDPVKLAQLDAEFERDKVGMLQDVYATRERNRELERARHDAASKYPDVDPELYASASDATEVDRIAGAVAANINKHKPAAEGQPEGTPSGTSWGGPPAVAGTGASAEAPQPTREERMAQLAPELSKGKRAVTANREYQKLAAKPLLDVIEGHLRIRLGDTDAGQQLIQTGINEGRHA